MSIEVTAPTVPTITCANCNACCCRLEVMLINDPDVPECYIDTASWGGMVMVRLDDGWCAALDRETLMCTIYDKRPSICREFTMGSNECIAERQ